MKPVSVPPRATRREWIGLAVLALPCLLYSMDLTVLNLAVPQLSADLQPSATQLLWIVDIYGFLVAGSLITMGTLGDRYGRRRVLMIGAAAFGVASVLAAFAPSAELLIAARALLGVAAATLAPSTLSLIRNMFLDPAERGFAIGIWIASFSAGGALGPLIGGLLLQHFWWGSVFLLAVPMMVLILGVGPLLLPEFRDPRAGRIDVASVALSLVAVLSVIYGIKSTAADGPSWPAGAAILVGLGVGSIFVRRQDRLAEPLIDIALFRNRAISAALGINLLALFIAFGSFLFIAQYLQLVLGMAPLKAGIWSAPTGIAFAFGSIVTPLLARRMRPVRLLVAGFCAAAVGLAVMSQLGGTFGFAALMVGMIVFCLGLSPIGTITTDLVIGLAPPEKAGAAAAISETSFEFGGAVGIAVLGSLVTALYRSGLAGALPAGLPPQAASAAQDTLAGAVSAAGELQTPLAEGVLAAARTVFASSLEVTFIVCAAIALLAAVLAGRALRKVPVTAQAAH